MKSAALHAHRILYLTPPVKLLLNKIPKARAYHPKQEVGILVTPDQRRADEIAQFFGRIVSGYHHLLFTLGSVTDPRE
tara:strand:- start:401 stop:634 length:234 start_codon:yes stop_codon:yes gene_type:complete